MTTKLLALCTLAFALTGCSRDQPRASNPTEARDTPTPDVTSPDVISGADPALPAPAASRPLVSSAEAVVTARLVKRQFEKGAPHCGILHVIDVMDYELISVESGTVAKRRIRVAQGCPEMPRSMYDRGAGTLNLFKIGATHRLELNQKYPRDVTIHGADYWAATTDPT